MGSSEEMAISLPKGNIRQWVVINLLRQKFSSMAWESSIQGDKFDIIGYPKNEKRNNHTKEMLIEVRGTSRTSINNIEQYGQFINRNKIAHGLNAMCLGDNVICVFMLVVPTQGLFTTYYPKTVPDKWETMNRDSIFENTGKPAKGTRLFGFKKFAEWKEYWDMYHKVIPILLPLTPDILPEYEPKE